MEKRIALVTGSTDGIGLETALELGRRGYSVILHGRSREKLDQSMEHLESRIPGSVENGVLADFSQLQQVRDLGRNLAKNYPKLNVVIHNAGTFQPTRTLSEDGWELTLQVNHLAPALLNEYLMRPLDAGAPSRLVWVSSVAHNRGTIPWDDLNSEKDYHGYKAYAASKLANALYAFKLARMTDPLRLGVFALHPGVIPTKILKIGFNRDTGLSFSQGAATSVYLATEASLQGHTGEYWSEGIQILPSETAQDLELQDLLYEWTQQALAIVT